MCGHVAVTGTVMGHPATQPQYLVIILFWAVHTVHVVCIIVNSASSLVIDFNSPTRETTSLMFNVFLS